MNQNKKTKKIISIVMTITLIAGLFSGLMFLHNQENAQADDGEMIEVSVKKVWDDYDDYDDLRPTSISVTLKRGNDTLTTVTLSDANNWYYKYDTPVARYDSNDEEISYTWTCAAVNGYTRYVDKLDQMTIITDCHHFDDPTNDSVILQKLDNNDNFLDECQLRLKDLSGNTLITWTSDDDGSINVVDDSLTATMNDDGSLIVKGLETGEYIYEEIKPKDGYTTAASKKFKVEVGNHSYTYHWYTSLEDAVADANNLTTENADCYRDNENCVAGLFIIGDVANLILLESMTYANNIELTQNTILELSNNTLDFGEYGIFFNNDDGRDFSKLINGTVRNSQSGTVTDVIAVINSDENNQNLTLDNVTVFSEGTKFSTSISEVSLISLASENIIINNCVIGSQIKTKTAQPSTKYRYIYASNSNSNFSVKNCQIKSMNGYQSSGRTTPSMEERAIESNGSIRVTDTDIEISNKRTTDSNCSYGIKLSGAPEEIYLNNISINLTDYGVMGGVGIYADCETSQIDNEIITNCNITGMRRGIYLGGSRHIKSIISNNTIDVGCDLASMSSSYGITGRAAEISNNTIKVTLTGEKTYDNGIYAVGYGGSANEIYDNDIRCFAEDKIARSLNLMPLSISTDENATTHVMSGYYVSDIIQNPGSTDNSNRQDALGAAIYVSGSGNIVLDESKGDLVAIGGHSAVTGSTGGSWHLTINGGTFKSPNHGGVYIVCGANGSCEINGGTFINNKKDYDLNEEPQIADIGDFASIYFGCPQGTITPWSVSINNAIIGNDRGGTYGLVAKGTESYVPPTIYLKNCYIEGLAYDLRLDNTATTQNSYIYIQDGTVLKHDGTDQAWYDGFASTGTPHIIDQR